MRMVSLEVVITVTIHGAKILSQAESIHYVECVPYGPRKSDAVVYASKAICSAIIGLFSSLGHIERYVYRTN